MRHQKDKLSKATIPLFPIKLIAKLEWTKSNAQQNIELYAWWFQARRVFYVSPYKPTWKNWPLGRRHFYPQGYNLQKFVRRHLDDATYQISKILGLVVSDKKMFSLFPYISWGFVCPRGILWTNLVDAYYMTLLIKCQGSGTCGFRVEDCFLSFHFENLF